MNFNAPKPPRVEFNPVEQRLLDQYRLIDGHQILRQAYEQTMEAHREFTQKLALVSQKGI